MTGEVETIFTVELSTPLTATRRCSWKLWSSWELSAPRRISHSNSIADIERILVKFAPRFGFRCHGDGSSISSAFVSEIFMELDEILIAIDDGARRWNLSKSTQIRSEWFKSRMINEIFVLCTLTFECHIISLIKWTKTQKYKNTKIYIEHFAKSYIIIRDAACIKKRRKRKRTFCWRVTFLYSFLQRTLLHFGSVSNSLDICHLSKRMFFFF